MNDEFWMRRCLDLAKKSIGKTSPNPMVGAVIIYQNKIIGEGYHTGYGNNHAEVEAINKVKNNNQLQKSSLYVNLEPCNHFGKTPPCVKLIIDKKIQNVIIGTLDPNPKVSGMGVKRLKENNINVKVGVLSKECKKLNKRFFCFHLKKRPFIILKWAESPEGLISNSNSNKNNIFWISSMLSQQIAHKWRSEEDAILVGSNTVLLDNPKLNTRHHSGKSPIPIVIDPNKKVSKDHLLFKFHNKVFHYVKSIKNSEESNYIKMNFNNGLKEILKDLYSKKITSILVEGGLITLQKFIDSNYWDEIRYFIGSKSIEKGLKAPMIKNKEIKSTVKISNDKLIYLLNPSSKTL
tara:strand:- start:18074 stop:19120 length:1047 start_codon:yes stop_codon:yes gene_type:complete